MKRRAYKRTVDGAELETTMQNVEGEESVGEGLVLCGSCVRKQARHVPALSERATSTSEVGLGRGCICGLLNECDLVV